MECYVHHSYGICRYWKQPGYQKTSTCCCEFFFKINIKWKDDTKTQDKPQIAWIEQYKINSLSLPAQKFFTSMSTHTFQVCCYHGPWLTNLLSDRTLNTLSEVLESNTVRFSFCSILSLIICVQFWSKRLVWPDTYNGSTQEMILNFISNVNGTYNSFLSLMSFIMMYSYVW